MTMLPRLQAEEGLTQCELGALAAGRVERHDAEKAIRRLVRLAGGGRRKGARATPDQLAAAGIQVVVIDPEAQETDNG